MPQLDLQTLVVVLLSLTAAIGAPLALMSGPRRGSGALWYWALALLAFGAGSLLLVLALRETMPPLISVMFGNALIICGVALQGDVAASLTKSTQFLNSTQRWFFAAVTAPVLGTLYLTVDASWPRVAYMAVVQCYLVGQLLWQLHTSPLGARKPQHNSVIAFEVLLWIYLGGTIMRIIAILALTPSEASLQGSLFPLAALLAILLIPIGTCVLIWHELEVRDEAIRIATSTDISSGLPNRATFLRSLERHLASAPTQQASIVGLLRLKPLVRNLEPYEEAAAYRSLGARIERFLARSDMLARTGDDEFGVLFHEGSDIARATTVLKYLLVDLQCSPVAGERDHHDMNAAAVLLSCGHSTGTAGEVVKILREGLEGTPLGEVRILTLPSRGAARSAA